DEGDRDRKKKDRDDDDNDRKERDDDRTKESETDQRIAGSADSLALTDGSSSTITTVGLDSGLFLDGQSPGQTIGELFYQDRDGQLLAINALPETGSLALMGIGLASLVIIRRRKPANSTQ
ncbi:MAG: PEP-CTERM sorting domain-containing protein, partial [Nitrosospira sp.]|nr:PEP-CTERM sorting domain-containing protein [Nitrosospira sp.]